MLLREFIDENFPKSVLFCDKDEGDRLGLPYPYTVPSPGDIFDCMFYWDTHFTNVGLLASGNIQQAIYNTDNIQYMIQQLGYMPNSTKKHHIGQSQPPFYYRMVLDIFEITHDKQWLRKHYDTISKEYDFWMKNRLAPNGLNFYGRHREYTPEILEQRYRYCSSRFGGYRTEDPVLQLKMADTVGVLCESGWDCCYRFEMDGPSYNPVDLNTLLYGLETSMSRFSQILGRGEDSLWAQRAADRKQKMDRFLYHEDKGFYLDWNFKECRHSPVISAASLFPLYLGLWHEPKNIMEILENQMLLPYGVAGTVKPDHSFELQWEYPNIWAPLQYVAYCACKNSGFLSLANTIAERYTNLLESNFNATHNLWEKYDGFTGQVVNAEYDAPPMLGWTAGVYLALKQNLDFST